MASSPALTPQAFVAKWRSSTLRENASSAEHVIDRCRLIGHRTLTNLYNERPTWLAMAHTKLDEAVFDAYDWPRDLTDAQILERLLALNLERAAKQPTAPHADTHEDG